MQAPSDVKRSLLRELIALLVYVLVAGLFIMPVLSPTGAKAGVYKVVFYFFGFLPARVADIQTHVQVPRLFHLFRSGHWVLCLDGFVCVRIKGDLTEGLIR